LSGIDPAQVGPPAFYGLNRLVWSAAGSGTESQALR
jgi:hypothetical protein